MKFETCETGNMYQEFRNMNGSKIYEENGNLFLVISYEDMTDHEIEMFSHEAFEVVFKIIGRAALFTFKFLDHGWIVDAPFDRTSGGGVRKRQTPLLITVFTCESSNGRLIEKRTCALSDRFTADFYKLRDSLENLDSSEVKRQIKEIYDNHGIEEIYGLPGDHTISCLAEYVA